MHSLLLGLCVCNEPIFRHRRPDGRQISCEELRRIDQEFFQSGAQPALEPQRQFQIITGGRDRHGAIGIAETTVHGGER